jgi:PAS domain S-box-containing protein
MGRPLTGQTDFIALLTDPDLLQLMLFACPDGVIVTDEDGDIALFAGASETMFGYRPVEVMGRSYRALLADDRSFEHLRDELCANSHVTNYEVPALRKGGAAFSAAVSAAVMKDRYGAVLGTVFYIRDHSEVREIEDALRSKNAQLNHLVSKLDHLAHHDQLTGLLRRGSAVEAAEDALIASGLEHHQFGVAIFDLDHFKLVNDSYGHLVGDIVLANIGAALRRTARQDDIVGRFGGEEFVAFLPGAVIGRAKRRGILGSHRGPVNACCVAQAPSGHRSSLTFEASRRCPVALRSACGPRAAPVPTVGEFGTGSPQTGYRS